MSTDEELKRQLDRQLQDERAVQSKPFEISVGCIVAVKSDPMGHKPLMVRRISGPPEFRCGCGCGAVIPIDMGRTIHVEWLEEQAGKPSTRWRVRTGSYPESMLHRTGGPIQ